MLRCKHNLTIFISFHEDDRDLGAFLAKRGLLGSRAGGRLIGGAAESGQLLKVEFDSWMWEVDGEMGV